MTDSGRDPQDIVWTIGNDDYDPRAFSATLLTDAESVVAPYVVGGSEASVDWPRVHPGPLDEATGFRSHTLAVEFTLSADDAAGDVALVLDFFATHGSCPHLEISLNDVTGRVVPEVVRASASDSYLRPSPTSGRCHRAVTLPPGTARVGPNTLTVTTVAPSPALPAEHTPSRLPNIGSWFGSALTWQRLALIRCQRSEEVQILLKPTPFYVEAENGDGLNAMVDAVVTSSSAIPEGTAVLSLAGDPHTTPFPGHAFGDTLVRFVVPEWQGAVEADLRLETDGRPVTSPAQAITAARKWTIHVLPHVHLDLGYTDAQAKVIELHSRNLERASGIIGETPEYRFTVDGSHTLGHFMRTRDASRREQILDALRRGQLTVNAFSVLFLSGLASLEEIYRATDLAFELSESSDIPVRHAHLTDVPSYSGSLPGILNSLGIDAFMGIANHIRGGNAESDELHLKSPLVWQGIDGADVLAFFADCYTQLRFICADPPVLPAVEDGLARFLALYERPDYLPTDLPLVGTHTDNEDLADGYADLVGEWAKQYAYPHLRFSTFSDYFDAVSDLRDDLPRFAGDGGSYWEDGAGTQAAVIAEYRTAQTLLPGAECLLALTSAAYQGATPDRVALDTAWEDLLIGCEHTWTAAHATSRPHSHDVPDQLDWKVSRIHRAWRAGRDESSRGLSQLAELMGLRAPAILVMNPTSRSRDLVFDIDLEAKARLVEAGTGQEVGFDALHSLGSGFVRARVRVPDVAPFGYTSLRVDTSGDPREIEWSSETTLTTARYSLTIDSRTGRITSLVHLPTGRQVLDVEHEHSLGEVLYVTGGGDEESRGFDFPGHEADLTSLYSFAPSLPQPKIITTPAEMRYIGSVRTPHGIRVRLEGSAPTMPSIMVDLEIGDDTDCVELNVQIDKEHELAKESVYVAFPFAMPGSSFRYDRQSGWVDPDRDHLPGACNDWLAVQSGVSFEAADGRAIVLATAHAPLVTLEPVQGKWATEPVPVTGAVYSWVMNNYWHTNTPASQGGRVSLRYGFQPMPAWDEALATEFVRSFRAPALVDRLTYQDRTQERVSPPLPASGQLLETRTPGNVDMRVYTSRKETGMLLRAQETAGQPASCSVRHPLGFAGQAWIATPSGQRLSPLVTAPDGWITMALDPRQDLTIQLGGDAC